MADFTTAGAAQAATEHNSLIDATMAALTGLTQQGVDAGNALVEAVTAGTDSRGDTALSLETRKLGELEAQNKNAEFYAALGMDLPGQAKLSTSLAAAFQANTRQALEQAQSIQDREAVTLLDNPLGHIWNQLILPDEKNALEATMKTGEVIKSSMNQLNKALDENARSETQYAKKLTTASVDSQVQGLKADIDAKAAQARMHAIQQNSHDLVTVLAADKQKLDTISQIVQMRNSDEHLALSREAAAQGRVKFDQWQSDQRDTEDYINEMYTLANDTAKRLGKPELTRKEVALALKGKAQPGMQQTIQAYAQAGYINKDSGALGIAYGETPTAALDFSVATRTPLPAGVSDIYASANAKLQKALEAPGSKLDKKNKPLMDAEYNKYVLQEVTQLQANIDSRDGTNPYRIPDLKVIAASEAVKNTSLFKNVLSVEVAAGGLSASDPDTIVAKGMVGVAQGKLTLGQLAQDITTFYKAGVQANNAEKQFSRYGMAEQSSYKTKVAGAGSMTLFSTPDKVTIDMTDLTQVNSLLAKLAASKRIGQSGLWR